MKFRHFLLGAAIMYPGAVLAAPPQAGQPGTSTAPGAAVKPCPQRGMKRGQGPAEQGMPRPGMQGSTAGPHAGPGLKQRAPAAGTRSASGSQQVFGRQFMTSDERTVYLKEMRAAKTAEERAAIRTAHH
jgi:hypothetical protein